MENEIGTRLRKARELKGLGVNELGKLSGVAGPTISRWECGQRQPRIEELHKVLRVLGLSYDQLFQDLDSWAVRDILKKAITSGRDIRLVLSADPALSPSHIEVIMMIVDSIESEAKK